ncbi:DUF4197 domain-containing protein [Echinicola strongylocentroti]|uniref:DUF4197 domain-containing protein n=1 Tax=Echinicola strongylocentroti TaxID=1795355 RepID=A0A2Z4IQW3_9BACT|nr:DUF4197 domain-containing protein [Echinicola strongylocentroti]AWW33120.1 DUF4197 domain-containing protein [Echinicola strongylocentroti]
MQRNVLAWMLAIVTMMMSCTAAEVNKFIQGATEASLSEGEVSNGLKEALEKGIDTGVGIASKQDGYLGNDLIRIGLPEDVRKVENTLRKIGLGGEVDKVITTINRGAEDAAKEAKPIFISAIKQMTIQDAWTILKGEDDAATQYLQRTTTDQLVELFRPHVQKSLDNVGATRYYGDLVSSYNNFPTTSKKLDPDLNNYVTQRAIEGLFKLIAEEEEAIRENPMERTSSLLKRVFAAQD